MVVAKLGDFFFLAEYFHLRGVDFILGGARLGRGACITVSVFWGGAIGLVAWAWFAASGRGGLVLGAWMGISVLTVRFRRRKGSRVDSVTSFIYLNYMAASLSCTCFI